MIISVMYKIIIHLIVKKTIKLKDKNGLNNLPINILLTLGIYAKAALKGTAYTVIPALDKLLAIFLPSSQESLTKTITSNYLKNYDIFIN